MKKSEIIVATVLGGLLLKVLHNQKVLDRHIQKSTSDYEYVYDFDLIENNTVFAKFKGLFKKEED